MPQAAPWYSQPRDYQVASGDTWVLGVNAVGVTPQLFDKRTQAHDLSSGDAPDFTEEMFHQIMLGYWGELNAFKDIMATTGEIVQYQLPSHGFARKAKWFALCFIFKHSSLNTA
jgi:hypothetical protein